MRPDFRARRRRRPAGLRSALGATLAFALAAAPAEAQRLPERFGLPAAVHWASTTALRTSAEALPTSAGGSGTLPGRAVPSPRWAPVSAQQRDTIPAGRLFVVQLLSGTAGSIAGLYFGAMLGDGYYRRWGEPCNCDDPGLTQMITGAALGSIAGTALGTHAGARIAGGGGGRWLERFGVAAVGLLAGLGAYAFLHVDPDRAPAAALVIPLTQAALTALATSSP